MRNLKKTVLRLKKAVRRIERRQNRILSELLMMKCRSSSGETEKMFERLREAAVCMEKESRRERDYFLKTEPQIPE